MILIVLTRFKHSQLWGKRPHYVDILSLTIFGRHWLIKTTPMKGRGSQISRTRKDPDWGERPGLPPTANINAAKRSLQTKVKQVDSRPPTKVGVGPSGFDVLADRYLGWELSSILLI